MHYQTWENREKAMKRKRAEDPDIWEEDELLEYTHGIAPTAIPAVKSGRIGFHGVPKPHPKRKAK